MARKKRKTKKRKGRRERRTYVSATKRRKALSVPISQRVLSFTDEWRARKRKIYIHAHPLRKIRGVAGYGFRNAWRHHRKQEQLRRKRDRRRYRDEPYGYRVDDQRVIRDRDKRVCKRRLGKRIALFALGKAGAGKSIRAYRRWSRDSYVNCR